MLLNIIMTSTVAPVVSFVYKRSKKHLGYKRRNLQHSRPDSELRLLASIHKPRNIPSVISLLDLSNPTKKSPIFVYALHLIELDAHAPSAFVIHSARGADSLPATHAQSEHIAAAFEAYEQRAGGVSVQPITAVSPFSTMHEDVCSAAAEHRAALIILPFHKLHTVDGGMETVHPAIRTLNVNVLKRAPCSVGVLVDRGLSSASAAAAAAASGIRYLRRVVVLFFGGADDREALAYAWRMAEQPAITLTVLRFIATGEGARGEEDEEFVSEFRQRFMVDESVVYVEKVVRNGEETMAEIRGLMEEERHDLFVVGKGSGESALMTGMNEWSECPELGPIGDFLASLDVGGGSAAAAAAAASVLVMQQYVEESNEEEAAEGMAAMEGGVLQYLSNHTASRGAGGASGIGGWHGAV